MTFFGLSEKEAEISRKKYGSNELLYKTSFGRAFLAGLNGYSCKLFAIAALTEIISAMLGLIGITDTVPVWRKPAAALAAAAVCALLEGALRYRSEKLLSGLCGTGKDTGYTVYRDSGKTERVRKDMLTVGDLVCLSGGDVVPADGAVSYGSMTVDQSVFGVLGKAEKTAPPAGLKTGGSLGVSNPYFVYGGSEVISGGAVIRITAVGKNTRIAGLDKQAAYSFPAGHSDRPGWIAGAAAGAAVIIGGAASGALADGIAGAAAVMALSCFCGKGLMTGCGAAGAVKRLAKKGVRLSGAEVLEKASGTAQAFIDRAGTLAEAEYSGLTFIDGAGKEYGSFKKLDRAVGEILKKAVVCTSSAAEIRGGDALDRALYGFVGREIEKVPEIKKQADVRADGENILSGATVTIGGKLFTFVRGSADILLERCSDSVGANGKKQKITNKSALRKLAETLSLTAGKYVAALAVSERGIKGGQLPAEGYALIGLAALTREPFGGAEEETARLEKLGVKTMLVTAESRESALYAAKQAGIKKQGGVILDSGQLSGMSDKELRERFSDIKAVAGAAFPDRRRLVRAAKEKGLTVCAAVSDTGTLKAASGADWTLAVPGCTGAAAERADASAEGMGIKALADIIAQSDRFGSARKTAVTLRSVCAVLAAAALIFLCRGGL